MIKVAKLLIVMPVTNAVSERLLSAVQGLYTDTRNNMSQSRLSHKMVLHVLKEKTDFLSLVEVTNNFVKLCDHLVLF